MHIDPFAIVLNCIHSADSYWSQEQNIIRVQSSFEYRSTNTCLSNTRRTDSLFNARVFLAGSESHASAKRRMPPPSNRPLILFSARILVRPFSLSLTVFPHKISAAQYRVDPPRKSVRLTPSSEPFLRPRLFSETLRGSTSRRRTVVDGVYGGAFRKRRSLTYPESFDGVRPGAFRFSRIDLHTRLDPLALSKDHAHVRPKPENLSLSGFPIASSSLSNVRSVMSLVATALARSSLRGKSNAIAPADVSPRNFGQFLLLAAILQRNIFILLLIPVKKRTELFLFEFVSLLYNFSK